MCRIVQLYCTPKTNTTLHIIMLQLKEEKKKKTKKERSQSNDLGFYFEELEEKTEAN